MIDETQRLISTVDEAVTKVNELHAAIDALPDVKNVVINVDAKAAIAKLDAVRTELADIESKTVVINVIYKSVGGAPNVEGGTRVVNTVYTGGPAPNPEGGTRNVNTVYTGGGGSAAPISEQVNLSEAGDINAQLRQTLAELGQVKAAASQTEDAIRTLGSADSLGKLNNDLRGAEDAAKAMNNEFRSDNGVPAWVSSSSNAFRALDAAMAAGKLSIHDYTSGFRDVGVGMLQATLATRTTTAAVADSAAAVGPIVGWWRTWGTVIHWVVAAGAEFLATFIPAMVAFGAAAAVMIQGATNIYQRMSAVYTVAEALGPAIGKTAGQMIGLGNGLQRAQDMMQPAIYELFGSVINGLNTKFGSLWTMGEKVIYMLDDFAAKVDVELKGALGDQLNGLVSKGADDLRMFGEVLGNLGHALLNFAAAMPGLAEVLLKLLTALSDLIKIISEIPAPILTAAMAFEEFLRWGSAVNGLISLLLRGFGGLAEAAGATGLGAALKAAGAGMKEVVIGTDEAGKAITADMTTFTGFARVIVSAFAGGMGMGVAVVAWGALVAVAVGAFIVWAMKGKSATDQWAASINKMVMTAPDFAQVNTTISALSQTTQRMAGAQDQLNTHMGAWSRLASGAQENVTALQQQSKALVGDITTESENVGILSTKLGVSMPTAIAIAQGAGVKLTDVLTGNSTAMQVNWQKIQNLLAGYKAMDQQGNQVVADINMVTIANSGLLANVDKLNQAWTKVIGLGQGVQTSFISFSQGLNTIAGDAKVAGASLDGINSQSLTLRNDFQTNITAMGSALNSLNTALAIGGLSQANYKTAVATMVKEMLAVAPASQATAAQLGLIASAAGYTGNNYNQLAGWANKYGGTQSQLNGIMDKATIGLSNQQKMLQQLQGSLQTDVINTTAQAVLAQGGFQQKLMATYDAFKSGGASSKGFKDNLASLDGALRAAGMSTQQISDYNKTITQSWQQAGVSAESSSKKTGSAFQNIGTGANGLQDQIKNVFIAIGHEMETIWDTAVHTLVDGVKQFWGVIASLFKAGMDLLTGHWSAAWNEIKQAGEHWWKLIVDAVKATLNPLAEIVKQVWDSVPASWRTAITGLVKPVKQGFDDIKSAVETAWGATVNFLKQSVNDIKGAWDDAWGWIKRTAETAWRDTVGFIQSLASQFDKWWSTHGEAIKAIWNAIWDAIKSITLGTTHVISGIVSDFWTSIERFAKLAWGLIGPEVTAGWALIKGAFDVGMAVVKGVWSIGWAAIQAVAKTAWDLIKAILQVGWALITNLFRDSIDQVKGIWDIFWALIKAVVVTAWDAVKAILKIGWDLIVGMFSVFIDVITGHWHQAWVDIQSTGEQIWNAISGFFRGAFDAYKGVWDAVWNYVEMTFSDIWKTIKNVAEAIWNAIAGFFTSEWDIFKGFVSSVWNTIANTISTIWHTIDSTTRSIWNGIMGFFRNIWTNVQNGFNTAVNGISRVWGTLQNIFEKPVSFLINTVYDNGIARLWNDVASKIGIPTLPKLAAGGKLPGFGGGDILPALLEPGETVVSKEHSRQLAHVFAEVGVPGYQTGGVPSSKDFASGTVSKNAQPSGGGSNIFSDIWNGLKDASSVVSAVLTGNMTALKNDMLKFIGAGGASGALADMITGIPKTLIGDLVSFITGESKKGVGKFASTGNISYAVGKGVDQWSGMVDQALMMLHLPLSLASRVLFQMQTESGGNPNAINNWDINAKNGDPSRGLMQVIGTTFAAYHVAGTSNNIYDPLANIAAAINYARHVYGPTLGALGSGHGYDQGGWLMPGTTLAYNGTGKPERVLSPTGAGPGGGGDMIHVHLNMNDREIASAIFPSLKEHLYQYNARNNGNANVNGTWRPL